MFKRRKKVFKWQINASAVGKLLGYFGQERRQTAIAECWQMNLKRMPRIGATPAETQEQKPVAEIVVEQLEQTPVFKQMVEKAIESNREQSSVVQKMKETAVEHVNVAKRKFALVHEKAAQVDKMRALKNYPSKKSGIRSAGIDSFFTAKSKIYHKTSRKTASLSTLEIANEHGYQAVQCLQHQKQQMKEKVEAASDTVKTAKTMASHVEKQAMKVINTTRGIRRESTDLELVQKRFPSVRAGNDRAYFMHITGDKWSAFLIGKIDGLADKMIFELKHRQSRLFREFRPYEQVQCMLYMKMVKSNQLMLVETYEGQQVYYEARLDSSGRLTYRKEGSEWSMVSEGLLWDDVKRGIERVVVQLNRAERDAEYREELKAKLY